MALTAMQRRINANTGVNRSKVTKKSSNGSKNTFRRKSNGGQGG